MNIFGSKKAEDDKFEFQMKAWEKAIDVQMHFNELQMKIRNFAVLLISAIVGAAGVALKEHVLIEYDLGAFHVQSNLSSIFLLGGALIWLCFYFMDYVWYHPLLVGAVKHGMKIENEIKDKLPAITLTETISKESPQKVCGIKLRSKAKSSVFYISIFALLIVLSILSSWVPLVSKDNSKNEKIQEKGSQKNLHQTAVNYMGSTGRASVSRDGAVIVLNQKSNSDVKGRSGS